MCLYFYCLWLSSEHVYVMVYSIHQLPANYLVLPCQVLSVMLAHVRPARGQAWAPEVTGTLAAELLNKEVTCTVVRTVARVLLCS
jgi:hypothetical protein